MADLLPSYLTDLVSAFNDKSSDRLEGLIPLHPVHQAYRPLQSALNSVSPPQGLGSRGLTIQLPEAAFSARDLTSYTRRLPQDVRDNCATFIIALLRFVRLQDGGDFEMVYAKFASLVSAYT